VGKHNWKVGQAVYVVPFALRSKPYTATITKVGRVWATLRRDVGWREFRFNLASGYLDGDGRVYESPEDHAATVELDLVWSDLRRQVDRQRQRPATVTLGAIQTARDLLFGAQAVKP
jgi:hypothetical protein